MKSKSYELQKKINYEFQDVKLLKEALTHSSYSNENKGYNFNERLEFLGDSILSIVISDYLFKKEFKYSILTAYFEDNLLEKEFQFPLKYRKNSKKANCPTISQYGYYSIG